MSHLFLKWVHSTYPALDKFNYWACTAIALFFFVFILTPVNTLGNVSFAFLMLGLLNLAIQPAIAKHLVSKPVALLALAVLLFSLYDLVLLEWVRNEMSGRLFRNAFGFILGLSALAVYQKYGWNRNTLLPAIILGVWLGAFYSFEALFLGSGRASPVSYNTIYMGIMAALQLGFLLPYGMSALHKRQWVWVVIIGVTLVVSFLNIMASGSRGPLVAILLSIPVIIWFSSQSKLKAMLVGLLLTAVLATSVVGIINAFPSHPFSQRIITAVDEVAEFFQGEIKPTSSGIRLQLWHISLEAVKASPWFGLERVAIDDLKNEMIASGLVSQSVNHFGHMHNDVLHILATKGVLGLGLFLFFLAVLLKAAWQHQSIESALLFSFVVIFFTSGLSNALTASGRGAMLLFILSILLLTAVHHSSARSKSIASD